VAGRRENQAKKASRYNPAQLCAKKLRNLRSKRLFALSGNVAGDAHVPEDADMEMVIGPVLKRAGGYAFDTWTPREGTCHGFAYPRIEDAIYARKATIRAAGRSASLPLACQTIDEFQRLLDGELPQAA
jgi:hypothetical protein